MTHVFTKLTRRPLTLFTALLLIASSCKQKQPAPPKSETAPAEVPAPYAAPVASGAPVASSAAAGELAENIYDAAKANDWATAAAKLDTLHTTMSATGAPAGGTAALDRLSQAISAKDRTAAMEVSNSLTRDFAEATAEASHYPVEITMLDYLGRALEIGAAKGNAGLQQLASTTKEIRSTWDKVRPQVIERGGAKVANAFDKVVTRVEAARTPADYNAAATTMLDEVDKLEGVFPH